MWFADAEGLAEYAGAVTLSAYPKSPNYAGYRDLSRLDPLPAVIRCALNAKAITANRARQLALLVTQDDFSDIVGPKDPLVMNADDMKQVPMGAFIAVIYVEPGSVRKGPGKGRRHLIHIMVSLGNGSAAGTQGGNIGLPVDANWRSVNLAKSLNWLTDQGTYNSITESLGQGSPRRMRIRYRNIESFQENKPTWPDEPTAVPANQQVLAADHSVVINPGDVWYVGDLADRVGLAAVKPARSLDSPAANKQIFLYHVNGGFIGPQLPAYQALLAFLGNDNADWVFVHGASSKTKISIDTFYRQSFYGDLVEGRNSITKPHILKHFSGNSLQMDSNGAIVNLTQLIELAFGG